MLVGIPVKVNGDSSGKVNGDSSGKPNGAPVKAQNRWSEATLAG
jgi:hypothetical protein